MSDPIFSTLEDTQQKQRVTNLEAGHAVLEQLDLAIDSARVEFYTRLGLDKLNELIAVSPVDPPTTDEHYRRLLAEITEQNLLRLYLMRWLTALSKEGNASRIHQEWNDISAFRELSASEKEAELARLQAEIDRALGVLDGSILIGTPRGRAIAINAGTEGVYDASNPIEWWRVVGTSLFGVDKTGLGPLTFESYFGARY